MTELPVAFSFVFTWVYFMETGLYVLMPPAWMARLPFRHVPDIPLNPDGNLKAAAKGVTNDLCWRYLPAHRMLVFRRRLGFGPRMYMQGSIQFKPEGIEVRWMPYGICFFSVLCVFSPFLAAASTMGPIGFAAPVFFISIIVASWVIGRRQFRTTLLPEMEMAWLDHQQARQSASKKETESS